MKAAQWPNDLWATMVWLQAARTARFCVYSVPIAAPQEGNVLDGLKVALAPLHADKCKMYLLI